MVKTEIDTHLEPKAGTRTNCVCVRQTNVLENHRHFEQIRLQSRIERRGIMDNFKFNWKWRVYVSIDVE